MEGVKRAKSQEPRGFLLKARHLFLTYPKNDGNKNKLLEMLLNKLENKVVLYAVCSNEKHEDGTNHLHAYVQLREQTCFKNPNCLDFNGKHGDYKTAFKPVECRDYVMKDGDYVEYGEFKTETDRKREKMLEKHEMTKEHNKLVLENKVHELVDNGQLPIIQVPLMEKAKAQYIASKQMPGKIIQRECIWIYGKPGCGKSTWVRNKEEVIYEKNAENKWWDMYQHEEAVLIEDLDDKGAHLSHKLKIWADNFRFPAEIKGGQCYPTYTRLYVTSNYVPEHLFTEPALLEAIKRRFKIKTLDAEYNLVDYFYDPTMIEPIIQTFDRKLKKKDRSRDNSPVDRRIADRNEGRINNLEFELRTLRAMKKEPLTSIEEEYKKKLFEEQQKVKEMELEIKKLKERLVEQDEYIKKLNASNAIGDRVEQNNLNIVNIE